jgi:hypothetical protein
MACSGTVTYEDIYVVRDGGAPAANESQDRDAGMGGQSAGGTPQTGAAGEVGFGGQFSGAAGTTIGGQGTAIGSVLYVKASNPDARDEFGVAVVIWDNWMAVGARGESSRAAGMDGDQTDNSRDSSGAVYLYSDEGLGWAQRSYVKASNPDDTDGFGVALALAGDTLVVGAPFEDGAGTGIDPSPEHGPGGNMGAVYIFSREDAAWHPEAYAKPSNTAALQWFGTSLAMDGDRLVVGAPGDSHAGADATGGASGAVFVFARTGGAWGQEAWFKASNAGANDQFGSAVALQGNTLVVGAPGESSDARGVNGDPTDDSASRSGAVYAFGLEGATWRQMAYLKASNSSADSQFGSALALDGDTLAVGVPDEATATASRDGTEVNTLAPNSGAVYVFERTLADWQQRAYLKSSHAETEAYFGVSVALMGDTLLVGALGEVANSGVGSSGVSYLYRRTSDGWTEQTRLVAPNADAGDRFGQSVALSPTLFAVGASGEASSSAGLNGDFWNNLEPGAGAVYLYRR